MARCLWSLLHTKLSNSSRTIVYRLYTMSYYIGFLLKTTLIPLIPTSDGTDRPVYRSGVKFDRSGFKFYRWVYIFYRSARELVIVCRSNWWRGRCQIGHFAHGQEELTPWTPSNRHSRHQKNVLSLGPSLSSPSFPKQEIFVLCRATGTLWHSWALWDQNFFTPNKSTTNSTHEDWSVHLDAQSDAYPTNLK